MLLTQRKQLKRKYTMNQVQFDLVDEMQWEDVAEERGLFVSLESAELEEGASMPFFGGESTHANGIYAYTNWFYDGDDSAFSVM
jgi:hypothetical protein